MNEAYKKKLIILAEYYNKNNDKFFVTDDAYQLCRGYKIVNKDNKYHLVFTNQWTLVDIPLAKGDVNEVKSLLDISNIQRALVEDEKIFKVLNLSSNEAKFTETADLVDSVKIAKKWLMLPTGEYVCATGIVPSIPFLNNVTKYKKVTNLQVTFVADKYTLSIAPMQHLSAVCMREAVKVKKNEKVEEPESFGLFF